VAHLEQRVHVPAEAQDPRLLGDLLVHRRVAVNGHHLQVGVDLGRAQLRPRALAEVVEQLRELLGAVQADVLVADEVAERRDRLDVVADVGRGAVGAGVAVVDDGERGAVLGRRRRGGGVAVGLDPRAHPLDLADAVAPRARILAHVALEHGEHLARELLVAVAEHRREDVEPRLGADRVGVLGDEPTDLFQGAPRVDVQAGAHVLDRRVPQPEIARRAAQLVERELEVALLVGDDPAHEVAELGGLLTLQEAFGDGGGRIRLVGGEQRPDLGDDRVVDPAADLEAAQQRLARRGCRWGSGLAPARLRRLRCGLRPQPPRYEVQVAAGQSTRGRRHG
jgi:hypothetical protein